MAGEELLVDPFLSAAGVLTSFDQGGGFWEARTGVESLEAIRHFWRIMVLFLCRGVWKGILGMEGMGRVVIGEEMLRLRIGTLVMQGCWRLMLLGEGINDYSLSFLQ
jgi:hypothetical protein